MKKNEKNATTIIQTTTITIINTTTATTTTTTILSIKGEGAHKVLFSAYSVPFTKTVLILQRKL